MPGFPCVTVRHSRAALRAEELGREDVGEEDVGKTELARRVMRRS